MVTSRKKAHGTPCPYCRRTLQRGHPKLAPTRDHYLPQSQGGTGADIVIACLQCNGIKGDMMPAQWAAFMAAFAGWWKLGPGALRKARWTINTPGIAHAQAEATAILSKPRNVPRHQAGPPLVVPPELIWPVAATARPACALAPAEAPDTAPASIDAPAGHSGDLL